MKSYTYELIDTAGRVVYVSHRASDKRTTRTEARIAHAHVALTKGLRTRVRVKSFGETQLFVGPL